MDVIEAAFNERFIKRFNGRRLSMDENVAEHSHLAAIYGHQICSQICNIDVSSELDIITYLLYHDLPETIYGDILSITRQHIDGLDSKMKNLEETMLEKVIGIKLNKSEKVIVDLADLKSCLYFVQQCDKTKTTKSIMKRLEQEIKDKEIELCLYWKAVNI